ncbi:MAG: DUF368 domain-containing protein [Bacteroidales bacterium]|jgi:putative membrane protein|nr:DUF368 domain-containing protein [Bacteroidales bacterium]MDI9533785.1 DUF368 domain-containing protein [Bacteroidota bacterium]MBK7731225.1 DUF368 domain-containing protein [Bacteroidales bacterium]MBP7035598.1 DUF368 domain-containing protein [Bacteroidales bacterium]MBP8709242.1 DUF368 domain-containing protein [Bacteroidales bacterium]
MPDTNKTVGKFHNQRRINPVTDWIIRLLKGTLVGIGAILPGLSGGVLAVIFGLYEPLLKFLADLKKDFVKNVLFFIPVIIGVAFGIFLFAIVVEKAFGRYAAIFVCLFIGFVIGTFPSLYKTAGKKGRSTKDMVILIISALAIFTLMLVGEQQLVNVTPDIPVWFGSGALIGLGLIVPGMSPSNFLIYFGLYDKMAAGINSFDMAVVIPLTAGVIVCVLLFAKLASFLFRKYYSGMYHFILGMVVGSSLAIFPVIVFPAFKADMLSASGLSFGATVALCLVMLVVGSLATWLFSKVEEKYPREDLF